MPEEHKKYGGSTATRTLNCPAWVNIPVPAIERESAAAARGTLLHSFMEAIYNDETPEWGELDPEDREAIDIAHQATERVLDKLEVDEIATEVLLTLREDIGGYADMLAWNDEIVVLLDYKFGYQPITSFEQFLLYHICGQRDLEWGDIFAGKRAFSAIIQPAASEYPLIAEHTAAELERFHDDFLLAVANAETGTRDGNPGSWCKYCPAAAYCPAKREQAQRFLQFDPKQSDELANAMGILDQMEEQVKAVKAEAFKALEAGMPVPGWKLVLKKTRRYWTDTQAVLRKLRYDRRVSKDQYLEEVLRSPAQVTAAVKKAGVDLSEFIESRSSGTTIAPASDPRPAVEKNAPVPEALENLFKSAVG